MVFELPPELWLKIFRLLPFESLRNTHTVSWVFSDLSSSLLFEDVLFYLQASWNEAETKQNLEQELTRVAFCSSDNIASRVRKCTVEIYAPEGSLVSVFVAACFEAVSKFTNLRTLSYTHRAVIEMPALRVDELSSLKSLDIGDARLAPPTSESTRLRIEDFTYARMPKLLSQGQTVPSLPYLSFFDPSCLSRLRLGSEFMFEIDRFLADKVAMASFRHLRVLELELNDRTPGDRRRGTTTTMAHLHACISHFPAVEDLTLRIPRCEDSPVPPTPLAPRLRAYKGPISFIRAVDLRSTILRTLALTSVGAGGLLRKLQHGESTSTAITYLTMSVWSKDLTAGSILRDTLSFFPNLRTLTMQVPPNPESFRMDSAELPSLVELVQRLAMILGVVPALEELALEWWLWSDDVWKSVIPSAEELETTLLPALPSVRQVSCKTRAATTKGRVLRRVRNGYVEVTRTAPVP
ncbi:hypothetical protein K438DRAFT_1188131 [Mycena galopus ATCC 62051]|nr:hypothetical protein K438DRAFT_1188131 [Mycena galopus ATCC 62051]